MPGTVFTPATVRVLTGDSVMFANHDTRPHTATAVDASFDTGSILPHGDATVAFPVAGSYAYFCRIHSFMRGRVDVVALLLAGPATPPAKGAAATLSGRAGTGITSVTLERADGPAWTTVATTAPGAGGAFAFSVRLSAPATFRVEAAGATSDPVTLRPIDLRVGLVRTARHGSRYTLRAGIAPVGGAAIVAFQRYVPSGSRGERSPGAERRQRRPRAPDLRACAGSRSAPWSAPAAPTWCRGPCGSGGCRRSADAEGGPIAALRARHGVRPPRAGTARCSRSASGRSRGRRGRAPCRRRTRRA